MHVAVFENRFCNHRGAVSDCVHRHELRLHIGGKRRVGRGAQAHAVIRPAHSKLDEIAAALDFRVGFFELVEHGIENVTARIGRDNLPAGSGGGNQKRPRFDAIRHDGVSGADQAAHALYADHIRAVAFNFRAHRDEAIGEIDHFRLPRGIFQRRHAVGQGRGHHEIFRSRDGDFIHENARAF